MHDVPFSNAVKQRTKQVVGAMCEALSGEREAARTGSLSFIITGAGMSLQNGRSAIDLQLDNGKGLASLPDHEMELGRIQVADGKWYSVELVERLSGGVRVISADAIDPTSLPLCATLEIDQSWLLERQTTVLRELLNELEMPGPRSFRYDLALAALNEHVGQDTPPPSLQLDLDRCASVLNERQLQCVERSGNQGVFLVWGPPGTGKSRTLVETAIEHARAGQRVLVATPSNTTADQLASACLHRYEALIGQAYDAQVIRWGRRVKSLSQDESRKLMIDAVASARATRYLDALRTAPSVAPMGFIGVALPAEPTVAMRAWVADEVFNEAQIVVCPLAQLYLNRERFESVFDTLLVDEASMLLAPSLWIAAGYARQRVVIAGDPSQLGAPVSSGAEVLRTSVFTRHGADARSGNDSGATWLMLTEQHRMAPVIGNVVSSAFYGGQLRTAPCTVARCKPLVWPFDEYAGSLLVIDTSAEERISAAGRHAVQKHAELATELGLSLISSENPHELGSVLLLSAYRDQADQMRRLLKHRGVHHGGALASSTIHAAQGREADAVVLTLDDWPDQPAFLREAEEAGWRLLNVAISRARRGAAIIGPVDRLRSSRRVARQVRNALDILLEASSARVASDLSAATV